MNNLRFSTAVHILVLLDKFRGELITSEFIAGSINVNPVVVRREIKVLKESGLVDAKKGKDGGLFLLVDSNQILLGDLYKIVNQDSRLGRMNHPNPNCTVGRQMNSNLDVLFKDSDQEMILFLNRQSVADFSNKIT